MNLFNNKRKNLEREAAKKVLDRANNKKPGSGKVVGWENNAIEKQELIDEYQDVWDRFDLISEGKSSEPNLERFAPRGGRFLYNSIVATASIAAILLITFVLVPLVVNDSKTHVAESVRRALNAEQGDYYELQDGSTLELNLNTRLVYEYTDLERNFWVETGEVYFTVAKDVSRPFNVYVSDARIQALGTEFNVKYANEMIEVVVTEGRVQLSQPSEISDKATNQPIAYSMKHEELVVNQKAVIDTGSYENNSELSQVDEIEVDAMLSWKPVTLRFSAAPLSEVVASFNQFNETKLIIANPEINDLRIDATFRSNKLDGFVRLIQATSNVNAEYQDNTILLY